VQSFGISIHNTLYNFYKDVQKGNILSLQELGDLLKREWQSDGYNSKAYEKERFTQGQRLLEEFYSKECQPPIVPLALEMPFNFTLKNGVKIFGKIDRIDKTDNGIEIIDYKTGEDNPKAEKSHRLQLAIYALAATRVKDPILDKKPEEITLTLHFLEGNTKKTMTFKKEDLDEFENNLLEDIKEIEESNFQCSKNVLCVNCEYRLLCN
jgi:DNA helicase-2/ATP-dependent DNA helicase PcrA